MNTPAKSISRQDLYEEVWRTPTSKLAVAWNLPVSAIVKACEQLNIPRPGSGHWSLITRGWKVDRDPLPQPDPGMPESVVIQRSERRTKAVALVEPQNNQVSSTGAEQNATLASPTSNPKSDSVGAEPGEEDAAVEAKPAGKVIYTRKQLYEAVWSQSAVKLSAGLGISDVALAKTCQRLGVPRPSRGYWAQVAAGEKPPKSPLPPAKAGQEEHVTFDIDQNLRRREDWSAVNPPLKQMGSARTEVALPEETTPLHPRAVKLQALLEKEKPDEAGFIRVARPDAFGCEVTPALVPKLVRTTHAIIAAMEERGFKMAKGDVPYGTLRIVSGSDYVELRCEEGREKIEREPTAEEKRRPSWTWNLKSEKPTGRLSFRIRGNPPLRGRCCWTESDSRSLEDLLGLLVERIEHTFVWYEERRKRAAEEAVRRAEEDRLREERWRDQERQRREAEKRENHERRLEEIAQQRISNLLVAVARWVRHETIQAFLIECEARWKTNEAQPGLTDQQQSWLAWARGVAASTHPFSEKYPDPEIDGAFDRGTVPQGGPYPKVRKLEEISDDGAGDVTEVNPVVNQPTLKAWQQQYPFWLRYQRR